MKIHLGCGSAKEKDSIGIDSRDIKGVDIVRNLNVYPFPFEDSSVDEVICSYVVEKIKDLSSFMEELWRICKNDAKIKIVCPYYTHLRAQTDPLNIRTLSEWSFIRYSKKYREEAQEENHLKCNIEAMQMAYRWSQEWLPRSEEVKEFARLHYWNVIEDMMVELRVIKS